MIRDLLTKNGIAVMMLAREMLSLKCGDRIETIGEYAKKFDLGRGTIQTALKYLEDNKAIQLEPRGHLGTYITDIDYKKLWEFAGLNIISGVMPLPYSRRYEGLATGLYKAFEKGKIPFNMAYMRGSERRLEALLNGKYDFAIMSMLAAKLYIESGKNINIIIDFGPNTNVSTHRIIFSNTAKNSIEDGMKIAIDPTSIDQFILTYYECEGKDVEFIELPYNQIIPYIMEGKIDAAVWNYDEIVDRGLPIKSEPLKNKKSKKISEDNTRAALVVKRDNWGIDKIINRIVDKEEVVKIQEQVLLNKLFPEY
ncbi:GntR family transcriptional regulator YhfZ [Thermovenabulum gondwanense]|uniref:HTH gntR-type domain-containing protein n=1 Tax=Thermovenabulum gondwanense TaxID=520767 RepID=A0A162MS03_9FIRM|nr:GntR family transcriptional regulator YhfZ [Thermovenabulum gondwanense]KYO67047.1 hypothetical protein ATZ99_08650 [Thermovenabulum gondwanense]